MANFKTHMVVGATVSGVSSTLLLSTHHISGSGAMGLFFLGTVGSLIPDVDSQTSIPFKITFTLLTIVLSFGLIFSKPNYSLIEMMILWLAIYLLMKFVIMKLFTQLTIHRGIFHSIPMGVLFGFGTTLFLKTFLWIDNYFAIWGGFFITLGFITHLILDEVYSVDLVNRRMKKSFGTAFTLYKKENMLATFIIYGLIIFLYPKITDLTIVINTLTSSLFYQEILNNLLPHQGWFNGLLNI